MLPSSNLLLPTAPPVFKPLLQSLLSPALLSGTLDSSSFHRIFDYIHILFTQSLTRGRGLHTNHSADEALRARGEATVALMATLLSRVAQSTQATQELSAQLRAQAAALNIAEALAADNNKVVTISLITKSEPHISTLLITSLSLALARSLFLPFSFSRSQCLAHLTAAEPRACRDAGAAAHGRVRRRLGPRPAACCSGRACGWQGPAQDHAGQGMFTSPSLCLVLVLSLF